MSAGVRTVVNRRGRPPERCSKLGVCGVGVGAGHACRSRDALRLLTPSDGRGKRHPSTCTEDEDDAPLAARVEDDVAPPSPSVASSDCGLNQFAKMRLIQCARQASYGFSPPTTQRRATHTAPPAKHTASPRRSKRVEVVPRPPIRRSPRATPLYLPLGAFRTPADKPACGVRVCYFFFFFFF